MLSSQPAVFPTHGFGSFCSATATVGVESTIATQAATNPAALLDEHEFVAEMLAGLDTFPAYYKHMGPANEQGARPIDLTPGGASPTPRSCAGGSRPVNGWSTCASAGSGPPSTSPGA